MGRDADRGAFEALAATLGIAGRTDVDVTATLRAGTLALARTAAAHSGAAGGATVAPRDGVALERLLAEGGMGAVWSARQYALDREVAVKRPKSREMAGALVDEGRTTGALEHPGIVPIHTLVAGDDGAPLLVMKRIEGATLDRLLRDADHPAWPALERRHGDRLVALVEILMRVADALAFAHSRGYVHRDVKPENVMTGSFGEVYLLDFGVALRLGSDGDGGGEAVGIVGTPAFMAPEMTLGRDALVDARTDVYLLGATLHAILTGRPRHEGPTLHAVLAAAFLSEPPSLPSDDTIPEQLATLVRRATARDPDDRPQTALAFRDALADFLRHRGSLRLTTDAEERLRAIAPLDGDPPAAVLVDGATHRTLLECRYALAQALRDWSANERARVALRRVLRWLVLAELERRSPDAAATFLGELEPPDPELAGRVESVRATVGEARRLEAEARLEAYERDPGVAARQRLLLASGLLVLGGTLVALTVAYVGKISTATELARAALASLAINGGVFALVCVAAFVLRRRLFANRAARHGTTLLLLGGGMVLVGNLFAILLGPEASTASAAYSTLAVGAVVLGASLAMGRVALGMSIPLLVSAAIVVRKPEWADVAQRVAYLSALIFFITETALASRRRRR